MGSKPPSGGGPAPALPPPPQTQPELKVGTEKRRRIGQARNRTLLTQGLGGGGGYVDTEKKGLLGQ